MEELINILEIYKKTKDINKTGELLKLNSEDLKKIISNYKVTDYTSKMFWGKLKGHEPEPLKMLVLQGKPYGETFHKILYSRDQAPIILEQKTTYYTEVPK